MPCGEKAQWVLSVLLMHHDVKGPFAGRPPPISGIEETVQYRTQKKDAYSSKLAHLSVKKRP
jgi:hypothetical protein